MFNEDSRVKIPAIVHLTRLGYNYVSRAEAESWVVAGAEMLRNRFEAIIAAV